MKQTHKTQRRTNTVEERILDWDKEVALMKAVRDKILVHVSPALELGSGRTKRANKIQVLVHALMLLSPCYRDIPTLARALQCAASDMGVEAGVPRAQPVPLHDVIPYLNSNDLIGQPAQAPAICDLILTTRICQA